MISGNKHLIDFFVLYFLNDFGSLFLVANLGLILILPFIAVQKFRQFTQDTIKEQFVFDAFNPFLTQKLDFKTALHTG